MNDIRKAFRESVRSRMDKDGVVCPLAILGLGLAGEWGELMNADAGETLDEAGDVLWYLQAIFLHPAVQAELPEPGYTMDPALAVAKICDDLKKHLWHGRQLNHADLMHNAAAIMHAVEMDSDADFECIAAANMAKLGRRYPEGFVEGGGCK